jgi:hypothetical protein
MVSSFLSGIEDHMQDYPSNSHKDRDMPEAKPEKERLQRVTQSEAVQRKKPLGKRFTETFLGGDARGVGSYVMLDVLLPAARDMVTDVIIQGVERMVYGDVRSGSRRRSSSFIGQTPYNKMAGGFRPDPREPMRSRRAVGGLEFEEIIVETRVEAEHVLEAMFHHIEKFQQVTLSDLKDLVGITAAYTDNKWGWSDLRGADIRHVRNGYLIQLPPAEAL